MKHEVTQHTVHQAQIDGGSPRVYLLTDSTLYEIVFQWNESEGDHAQGKELHERQTMILGSLHELAMNAFELTIMADNILAGNATLLSISTQLREYEATRCTPNKVGERDFALPKPFLFVAPSFTTEEIHTRIEAEGGEWHYGDYLHYYQGSGPQPPQPTDEPVSNEVGQPLYDVMPISRKWEDRIDPQTRLTWAEVEDLIEEAEQAGGVIALRYYAERVPADGKRFDSLEWVHHHTASHSESEKRFLPPVS